MQRQKLLKSYSNLAPLAFSVMLFCSSFTSAQAAGLDVCDLEGAGISVQDTEDFAGVYFPLIKNCILLGVDPPPNWVPQGGRGYGIFKSQSGIQSITGKASSLCPRSSTNDTNKCGVMFPNCTGAAGDAANGGSKDCATGGAPVETPGRDGVPTLKDPTVNQETLICASGWEQQNLLDNFSICLGPNSNFCGFEPEDGQNCYGGADGRDPGPFPQQYADPGWAQINGVESAIVGPVMAGIAGTYYFPEGAMFEGHSLFGNCGDDYCSRAITPGTGITITTTKLIFWDKPEVFDLTNFVLSGDYLTLLVRGAPIIGSSDEAAIKSKIPNYYPVDSGLKTPVVDTVAVGQCRETSKTEAELTACLKAAVK